ncbi:MAG: permease [Planctomycetota bacterium]
MNTFSFNLSDFVLVWWGILYEAMPFVVMGTLLSGLVERCVSRETVVKFFPKNRFVGIGVSALMGLVFPMCECGVVPVVRRLMLKGVPASCGVAYMLAAPIINPLVILSTMIAFRGKDSWTDSWTVTGLRVGMGYFVAVVVGLVVWRMLGERNVLLPTPQNDHGDDHDHNHGPKGNFLVDILGHAAGDFMVIGSTLVVGAALAALINSGFSRAAMEPLAQNPWAAVSGMSALAIGLNLCSEADAFIARSFLAFPLAAKMAFLVLGPMVDLKLIAMYATVFRPKAILVITGLTTLLIFILCVTGYVWIPMITALTVR